MRDKLEAIKAEALAKIESAEVVSTLNDVKVAILGEEGRTHTGSQKHEGCSTGGQTKGRSDGK